jgi:tRNA(fMet)-specific endonuclease VapC
MSEGILDTSILVAFDRIDASQLPEQMLITTITLAELSVGPLVTSSAEERARRQGRLLRAELDYEPLPFDREATHAFGRVSESLRRAGRMTSARNFDAMIAAIALSRGLPVYTCNPTDFAKIDGLEVVAVATP